MTDDLAARWARHQPRELPEDTLPATVCQTCRQGYWPCDAAVLGDALAEVKTRWDALWVTTKQERQAAEARIAALEGALARIRDEYRGSTSIAGDLAAIARQALAEGQDG